MVVVGRGGCGEHHSRLHLGLLQDWAISDRCKCNRSWNRCGQVFVQRERERMKESERDREAGGEKTLNKNKDTFSVLCVALLRIINQYKSEQQRTRCHGLVLMKLIGGSTSRITSRIVGSGAIRRVAGVRSLEYWK